MKLLPNVGHVTQGSVKLLGEDLLTLSEGKLRNLRGNEVSMIFQGSMTSLNPTWTVGQQIAEAVRLHQPVTQKRPGTLPP
jgi:peptide/nickel transport system ATP-binding protein